MKRPGLKGKLAVVEPLRAAAGSPTRAAIARSRRRLAAWFGAEAPALHWGALDAPVGRIFIAASERGLCTLNFGLAEDEFLSRLDARARLDRNPRRVAPIIAQLREYFARERLAFDLPVDLGALTPFQCRVLEGLLRITPGEVWTYQRLADALGRPRSSRPVGQALARNPIPIVIPCHRVIASDGSLGGYSGGSGIETKRWLLQFEGALSGAGGSTER